LGTVQDGGIPHLGCIKFCCKNYFERGFSKKRVVSLGISDHKKKKNYLVEASPDISIQLNSFLLNNSKKLDGIFITHAHIGHYSGLINLGREVYNASKIPLYLMPKMTDFISSNGPWDQLVKLKNVELKSLSHEKEEKLTENLTIIPFKVPHRDEYSETVGYKIVGPNKSALFIPDIDKWNKWEISIKKLISKVDYAFLDGTFYDSKEINNRDISEIPHPFIIESLELFKDLKESDRNKIYFIHLNHTNPLLNSKSEEYRNIVSKGYNVALEGLEFEL
jgi:pyrroloquinoline quinone biosynthesis protein B